MRYIVFSLLNYVHYFHEDHSLLFKKILRIQLQSNLMKCIQASQVVLILGVLAGVFAFPAVATTELIQFGVYLWSSLQ